MAALRTFFKYAIPLILAVVIVGLVLNKVNVGALIQRISKAKLLWVCIAIGISLLAHWSRAYRWNLLLEPLGHMPKIRTTFAAVMIGYFGNIFLPRGGEVMRCMVLTKLEDVPFNTSFGTVVAERGFDFLCLLALIGFSLLLEYSLFQKLIQEVLANRQAGASNGAYQQAIAAVAVVVALTILALVAFRKKIASTRLFNSLKGFITGLLKGMVSILHMKKKGLFLLHTLFIWTGYYLMTYLMFFALSSTSQLGPVAGVVILIVGGLGMSAPVSGGIGPFHIMVAGALHLFYNITQDDGLAYAFVIHTSQMISIIVIGGICSLLVLFYGKNKSIIKADASKDIYHQ